eukprot:CAMPEP_0175970572 /NCGR_PEP_ID=MMETSP0108-20121206/41136_1 /TAXON_ID=195067 ORGANISM="Goniomonas pacifica, Strain CCMP1869" /NCGR_SAMPLE_ID=MMETSP0108 /ASSEMBLY_ACC=CAM_ASM_000204 /LENGTH=375 /DNA_ID=CAMNT_0017299569 /DNA_START=1 /DNA_END=1128 /DNA_ORIENTATION=-
MSPMLEALPCPHCESDGVVAPHIFSRSECVTAAKLGRSLFCPVENRSIRACSVLRPEVFISYSWGREESPGVFATQRLAIDIKNKLEEEAGVAVWLDIDQVGGGQRLLEEIDCGIRGCVIMLVLLDDAYASSTTCLKEFDLGTSRYGKYVLPMTALSQGPTPLPFRTPEERAETLRSLVDVVQSRFYRDRRSCEPRVNVTKGSFTKLTGEIMSGWLRVPRVAVGMRTKWVRLEDSRLVIAHKIPTTDTPTSPIHASLSPLKPLTSLLHRAGSFTADKSREIPLRDVCGVLGEGDILDEAEFVVVEEPPQLGREKKKKVLHHFLASCQSDRDKWVQAITRQRAATLHQVVRLSSHQTMLSSEGEETPPRVSAETFR